MPAKFKRKPPVMVEVIETELGLEKRCTKCDELYPLLSDFFYKDGKDKAGRAKFTAQCKDCYKQSYLTKPTLRSMTEVTGDDADIKREFERIERNQKIIDLTDKLEALDYLKAKQAKTPSVRADGV